MANPSFPITENDDANRLLQDDPLALLLGMMLDQQIPMEWAFESPQLLKERLGGSLDASHIAGMDPEELEKVFKGPRALHRFPGSMAKRAQALCQHLLDHHHGDAADVWKGATDGRDLLDRLVALPGFGEEKAKIFMAVLGKRFDQAPADWRDHAGVFADDQPRSVADIDSRESLERVRDWKKMMKQKGKAKTDSA